MGKTGKALKRRRLEQLERQAAQAPLDSDLDGGADSPPSAATDFLGGLVTPAQLAMTVKTLKLLSNKGDLKALRTAVFDFQRVGNEVAGTGNSLSSRISAALTQHRHTDALVLLAEMRIREQHPKLGALQRWVRECDAASRSDGSFGDENVLRVLDAVLRCTNGEPVFSQELEDALEKGTEGQVVVRQKEWVHRPQKEKDIYAEIREGRFPAPADRDALASSFRLLQETPGPERLPPNQFPALLFTSKPGSIPLDPAPAQPVTRVEHPYIPGCFMLTDLLSQAECESILAHAEAVGFRPDKPVGEDQASILAHNVYWLADEPFLETLYKRFLHIVPQMVDGGQVRGLNARFRVYRYVPGAIYRPHLDGGWARSGIDPVTGEYLYDSAPKDKPQWSKFTFLIYLNDVFDNGCTTFFLPSARNGTMNAFPIKPVQGCALVFPHGEAKGSLLHEGSPVEGTTGPDGLATAAKYVIRTEVLYDSQPVGWGVGGKEGEKDENIVA
ncbi:hypothetical protein JCM10207_002604 [Rhodosporidiobolus poonsookiae]